MNTQTSMLRSKRIWHNLILFGIFLAVKLVGADIDDNSKREIINNFDIFFNTFIFLWNVIIKVIDESRERAGKLNLSWWNIFGIAKELFRVIGVIRGG